MLIRTIQIVWRWQRFHLGSKLLYTLVCAPVYWVTSPSLFPCTVSQKAAQVTKQWVLQDLHYDSCDMVTCSPHYVTCKQWWRTPHMELARSFRQEVQPWHTANSHWQNAATKRPAPTPCSTSPEQHAVIRWIWRVRGKRQLDQGLDELVGALRQSHVTLIKTNGVRSHTVSPSFPSLCRWWIALPALCITWSRWI